MVEVLWQHFQKGLRQFNLRLFIRDVYHNDEEHEVFNLAVNPGELLCSACKLVSAAAFVATRNSRNSLVGGRILCIEDRVLNFPAG